MPVITLAAEDLAMLPIGLTLAFLTFVGPFPLGLTVYSWATKSEDRSLDSHLFIWVMGSIAWVVAIAITMGWITFEVV